MRSYRRCLPMPGCGMHLVPLELWRAALDEPEPQVGATSVVD
jgi:hypothetical protein